MTIPKTVLTEKQQTRILAGLRHLDPETIQAYVEETITDATELARIEGHLFDCEECLAKYNDVFDASSPYEMAFKTFRATLIDNGTSQEKTRLLTALEGLASIYAEGKERLLRWRNQLLGEDTGYGASLAALVLPNNQNSYLKVLHDLSAPTLDVVVVSSVRSIRGDGQDGSEVGDDLVITAEQWLDVEVRVTADRVTLEFINWPESLAPLVVLLPENDASDGLLGESEGSPAEGEFKVHFEKVPPGAYLLSIAPAERG